VPVVVIGTSYSMTVTVTGGTAPFVFGATGLPSGISINSSTGVISGFTNASAGDSTVYLSVTDTASVSSYRSFTFSVRSPLALAGAAMNRGGSGVVYCPQSTSGCSSTGNGYQIAASGGQTPYSYSITSGSLPSGLSMSSSGLVSGTPAPSTPANGGSYSFNVVATDALGQSTSTAAFTLLISAGPVIQGSTLPIAVVGTPYAYDIKRAGGYNDFNGTSIATRLTYSITGLSTSGLNYGASTGRIYGTPTTQGTYALSVTLTDGYGISTTKSLSLVVKTVGKTMDLKTARFSELCSGSTQCNPTASDIALLTATTAPLALNNNTQQFLVYRRTDAANFTISKIDSTGRVPKPGSNSFTTSVSMPAIVTANNVAYLKIADIDQDGYKDIVFTDNGNRQLCVMWNGGTVDTYGMPSGFSNSSYDCFPIPQGGQAGNLPVSFVVRNDLRPDSTNNGKLDIIVTSLQANSYDQEMVYILKNNCAVAGSCTSTRSSIFQGYSSTSTATITNTSTSATLPFVTFPGMPIVGPGLAANTTVSTLCTTTPCAVTLSVPAIAAATGSANNKINYPTVTSFNTPSYSLNGNTVSTAASGTAGAFNGQLIYNANCGTINQGIRITALTSNSATLSLNGGTGANPCAAAGSAAVIAYGPVSHMPILVSAAFHTMRDAYGIGVGWFITAKPTIPTGVTGVNDCPGIVIAGFDTSTTNNGYAYVMRQSWTGTQCAGDFQTHISSDEWLAAGSSPWLAGLVAEDFNNDGLTDIVVASNTAQTNSAAIRMYMPVGGAAFTGGTQINPQMQSRGTAAVGAARLAKYCIDGSTSCSYPALIATGTSAAGNISIFPNACTSPGCTTPFESGTPSARIDYPAPSPTANAPLGWQSGELTFNPLVSTSNFTVASAVASTNTITVSSTTGVSVGQAITGGNIPNFTYVTAVPNSTTITISQNVTGSPVTNVSTPVIPTRNDVTMTGLDNSASAPFFLVYPRNGSSSSDPLKGSAMIDSFPSIYLNIAEIGTTRLADINNDGKLDLLAFAPNQGFVGVYPTTSSGGTSYELGGASIATAGPLPNYLAAPSANGCPGGSTVCFPDPTFNAMATQQAFPQGASVYNDNIMDVADLNNDGVPDFAVNGYYSRGISVALVSSSGTVFAPTLYQVGSGADLRPQSFSFADLDQDGIQDIVAVGFNSSSATGFASWLKGNGDGTFQVATRIDQILNSCTDPRVVQTVDIDLDGRPEISVLCFTSQAVYVSRRNNSGTWVLQVTTPAINSAGGYGGVSMRWGRITTGTATGLDLAIVGQDGTNSLRIINNITLSINNPTNTGTFTVSATQGNYIALNGIPSMVEIADLNGDGYGDVVVPMRATLTAGLGVTGSQNGVYYTCASTGTGTCSAVGWGMEGYLASSVSVGELTSDGYPELMVGFQGTVSKLFYRNLSRVLNTSY
jgi:hypothetical protein